MRDGSCPIINMVITPGSELDKRAIKPKPVETYPDGSYLVKLDPVTFAAMMSSVGQMLDVGSALMEMIKNNSEDSSSVGGGEAEPTEELAEEVIGEML